MRRSSNPFSRWQRSNLREEEGEECRNSALFFFSRRTEAGCESVQKKSQVNECIAVARYVCYDVLYCLCVHASACATIGGKGDHYVSEVRIHRGNKKSGGAYTASDYLSRRLL